MLSIAELGLDSFCHELLYFVNERSNKCFFSHVRRLSIAQLGFDSFCHYFSLRCLVMLAP
jgi:hypothetical protein